MVPSVAAAAQAIKYRWDEFMLKACTCHIAELSQQKSFHSALVKRIACFQKTSRLFAGHPDASLIGSVAASLCDPGLRLMGRPPISRSGVYQSPGCAAESQQAKTIGNAPSAACWAPPTECIVLV